MERKKQKRRTGRVWKIAHAPEPSRRGSFSGSWGQKIKIGPLNLSHLQAQTLLSHAPQPRPPPTQQAGPRSTPVAKKMGSAADTCAEERKSKLSQLPLLSPLHPSAAATAFIVQAPSARHLTFNSSNAWSSPGPGVTALVYSLNLTSLAGRRQSDFRPERGILGLVSVCFSSFVG